MSNQIVSVWHLLSQSMSVRNIIISHNLQHDILFLHGLTMQELAACY